MKRGEFQVVCIAILGALSISNLCFAKYSGGEGTETNPYKIATPNDLIALAADTNDYDEAFVLVNDINMAGYTFYSALIAPDTGTDPYFQGTPFNGIFDGNDHSIISFTINTNGQKKYHLGLFGQINPDCIIKNLGIEDVNITSGKYSQRTGGLCGYNYSGSIINCYLTGIVTGYESTGGMCGQNYYGGSITNCYSAGTVTGNSFTGGLCGVNQYGNITNCYSSSTVTGGGSVGGLCGHNNDGNITNCYSTGAVTGGGAIGGLCGYNYGGSIINCYSTGTANGDENIGGLCGFNSDGGSISNCYSAGTVTGNENTGGLCGWNLGGLFTCYSTGNVTGGGSYTGGFCGLNDSGIVDCYFLNTAGTNNSSGEPLSDGEMKQQASFVNWAFFFMPMPVWEICNGTNYPKLVWQIQLAGDFTCPDGVDIYDLDVFAGQWLLQGDYSADIAPVPDGDGIVNILDFALFAENWLLE